MRYIIFIVIFVLTFSVTYLIPKITEIRLHEKLSSLDVVVNSSSFFIQAKDSNLRGYLFKIPESKKRMSVRYWPK